MKENHDKYKDCILAPDKKHCIVGHIYKISCVKSNKIYIGQTVSHRLNHGKYRPHGYLKRFEQHKSEALKNTKTGGCVILKSAIRKYGADTFVCELLEICELDKMDEIEKKYIKKHNTQFPNGYNITEGGKISGYNGYFDIGGEIIKARSECGVNDVMKRGREFGYKHKDSTKKLIKERINDPKNIERAQKQMKVTIEKHFDNVKIEKLSKIPLKHDYIDYIRPVYKKDTNELYNYIIRINRDTKFRIAGKNISLNDVYKRLENILKCAYEKQQLEKLGKNH
jgi:group I intron endonuclease